jgi:hypothetical protein
VLLGSQTLSSDRETDRLDRIEECKEDILRRQKSSLDEKISLKVSARLVNAACDIPLHRQADDWVERDVDRHRDFNLKENTPTCLTLDAGV